MTPIQPYTHSNDLLGDPAALRTRMQRESYLFFRSLIPSTAVDSLFNDVMEIVVDCGWTDNNGHVLTEPRPEGYDPVQRLQSFHGFAHRPEILAVIEALVEDTPFVHPRNIARITFPQAEYFTTPAHQDFVHIQGTPDTYTAWIPLSNCPLELGGLTVLAGSHQTALLPVHRAAGAGGLAVDVDEGDPRWRTIDYQAGDVILFHSHTVHKGLPNRSADRLRLSVVYRYQAVSQPLVPDGLDPHYNRLTWEEIYRAWPNDRYQYYWKNQDLTLSERDRSYQQNAEERQA